MTPGAAVATDASATATTTSTLNSGLSNVINPFGATGMVGAGSGYMGAVGGQATVNQAMNVAMNPLYQMKLA